MLAARLQFLEAPAYFLQDLPHILATYCHEDVENKIHAFYDGIKHKPEATFGNVKADVLADKDAKFKRINFCSVIRGSQWKG
jgi:hypothetical protein